MSRPILFSLHIPKAAGSTLEHLIYREYADQEASTDPELEIEEGILYYPGREGFFKGPGATPPPTVVTALRSRDVRAVHGHFSFGLHTRTERPSTYLTFVRDPAARVSSLYHHLARPGWNRTSRVVTDDDGRPFSEVGSLDEFVSRFRLRELDNDMTRRISGLEPAFGRCDASMLDAAKRNIERHFAAVGVVERFDESLVLAAELIGWRTAPAYVSELVNEERPPVAELAPEVRDAILERNELDALLHEFARARLEAAIEERGAGFADRVEQLHAARS